MYRDPWNNNEPATHAPHATHAPCEPRNPAPRPMRIDTARFNDAVKAFFETWRPPAAKRGSVPVPKVLTGFGYSNNGYLVAHYANPVSQRIEAWGLDVADFRNGRLAPRCFKA